MNDSTYDAAIEIREVLAELNRNFDRIANLLETLIQHLEVSKRHLSADDQLLADAKAVKDGSQGVA